MGLFDYRKSLYKNYNEELHAKDIERLNEYDTSMNNRWNETISKNNERMSSMYVPKVPTKAEITKYSTEVLPKWGYSRTDSSKGKSFTPSSTSNKTKKTTTKSNTSKKKWYQIDNVEELQNEGLRQTVGDKKYNELMKSKQEFNDNLDKNRLEKKNSGEHNFYYNYVEPLLTGLAEPIVDLRNMSYSSDETKKKYADEMQQYKSELGTPGKIINGVGNIGTNIALSGALGLNKFNFAKNPILNSAIREGIENTIMETATDLGKGDTDNFVTDRLIDFGSGALFGGALEGAGQLIKKGTSKFKNALDNVDINTKLGDTITTPNKNIEEVEKVINENTDVLKNKIDISENNIPQNTPQDIKSDFYEREASIPLNNKNFLDEQTGNKNTFPIDDNKVYTENMNTSDDILPNNVKKANEIAATELEDKGLSRHKEVTAANSDMVSDEVKEYMSKYELDYDIKHDKDVLEYAINESKKPNAVEDFIAYEGKSSAERVATGEVLFKKLQSEGNIKSAVNVLNKLSLDATNSAQTLRMYRMMNSLTPEGKLMYIQKKITKAADEVLDKVKVKAKKTAKKTGENVNDVFERLKKKYDIPTLTTEESKFILDAMEKTKDLDINLKADKYKYKALMSQVDSIIKKKTSKTFWDKVDSYRYINMLLNAKTNVKNFSGNAIKQVVDVPRDIIGTGVDKIYSKFTGERTKGLGGYDAWAEGFKRGASDNIADALGGNRASSYYENNGKLEGTWNLIKDLVNPNIGVNTADRVREGTSGVTSTFKNPFLGSAEKLMGTILNIGDRPFYEANNSRYIANATKLNPNKALSEIMEDGQQEGLESVFQQDSKLASNLSNLVNTNAFTKTLLGGQVPFIKTPINIANAMIDYSPGGLIKGAYNVAKGNQRKAVNQISSGILGTGLTAAGYGLANKGILSGESDSDRDLRNFNQQTGNLPYSLNIGDKKYTIDFAQPLAFPMLLGANLQNGGSLKDIGRTGLDTLTNNSYLSGVKNIADNVNYDGNMGFINGGIENYVNQLLPFNSAFNSLNKSMDNTVRETYSDNPLQKQINTAMNKYPILSQMLPQKVDTLGNPMEYNSDTGTLGNILRTNFLPSNVGDATLTDKEQAILNAYEDTGDKGVFPYKPTGKDFNYREGSPNAASGKVTLTADEYTKYSQLVGEYTNRNITRLSKADDIKKIIDEAKDYAKDQILKDRGLTYFKDKKTRKEYYK